MYFYSVLITQFSSLFWRGARVDDWDALEMRCGHAVTVGSNPTLSAIHFPDISDYSDLTQRKDIAA